MLSTMRSEWIKLTTVVVHWVLVLIAVLFPIVVVTLVSLFGDLDFGGISGSDLASLIVGLTVVTAMLLGTTAAISITSEYSHQTIRPTYAATPKRVTVVTAKVVVVTLGGVFAAAVAVFGSWLVGSVILATRDSQVGLTEDGVIASLVAAVVLGVLVVWFACGLALIIRNSPATVSLLLLWPLLVENLIVLVLNVLKQPGAADWLPYSAAINATTDSGIGLGRPEGQILFGAVGLALIVFGTGLEARRDA